MTLAYWIMILFVIATCIFIYFYLTSNANQCLADPLNYYSEKMDIECYCMNKNVVIP
jgi:hypothetical protein